MEGLQAEGRHASGAAWLQLQVAALCMGFLGAVQGKFLVLAALVLLDDIIMGYHIAGRVPKELSY